MPHRCLQSFLDHLEQQGELQRISEPVSPFLEVTGLAQCEATSTCTNPSTSAEVFDGGREALGGKALFLENIRGSELFSYGASAWLRRWRF
jgi:3-polyprenyl-4-hydroxybenzoate decarboxylase